MNVAISVWNGRVSPVFDASRCVLLVDTEGETIDRRGEHCFASEPGYSKIRELVNLDVDVLICGAISKRMASALAASGVGVIPWVSGGVDEVLRAFLRGTLSSDSFSMPGCRGRNRCRWGGKRGAGGMRRFPGGEAEWKGGG